MTARSDYYDALRRAHREARARELGCDPDDLEEKPRRRGVSGIAAPDGTQFWFIDAHRAYLKQVIYFIRDETGPVKIGTASCTSLAHNRLVACQTGNPNRLEMMRVVWEIGDTTEKNLHKAFEEHRMLGEWFSPNALLYSVIGLDAPT